ncbi:hypothetical protein SSX86_001885 [Deinandra increscens subsp. villosa]|uniref:Uncharacterized protein n=1 Tax=Deinandra increscens subsp. villosa TaxID=3103831 RepID=A0AAP0DSJ3_9ASTR
MKHLSRPTTTARPPLHLTGGASADYSREFRRWRLGFDPHRFLAVVERDWSFTGIGACLLAFFDFKHLSLPKFTFAVILPHRCQVIKGIVSEHVSRPVSVENFVGDVPLTTKILVGLTTGAVAISVANPTDVVKVHFQADGKLAAGLPRRYSGALNAYSTIARQVNYQLCFIAYFYIGFT